MAKLLRNETLTSLPKNLEPVFYNAASLLTPADVISTLCREAGSMEPGAACSSYP